jgi:hypothetical protein
MSKVKNTEAVKEETHSLPRNVVVVDPVIPSAPPPQPVVHPKMAEEDKLVLELAKARRDTALAQAKESLAKNETAELSYKYVILQLYMKYGLNQNDAIGEDGSIIRGGAAAAQQSQQR